MSASTTITTRRSGAALVLVAAVLIALLLPSEQARAAGCGDFPLPPCIEVALVWECPGCPDPKLVVGHDRLVLPVVREHLAEGWRLVTQAHDMADRGLAAALRGQGLAALRHGATATDGVFLVVRPDPDPWLRSATDDLVSGLGLYQQAAMARDAALAERLAGAAATAIDRAVAGARAGG